MSTLPPVPSAEILSQKPVVDYAYKGVAPPWPFYVKSEDFLVVRIKNSLAGIIVGLTARIFLPDDPHHLSILDYRFTPTADRIENLFTQQLIEGWLVSMALGVGGTNNRRGQTYVFVDLGPGGGTSVSSFSFASAYVAVGERYHVYPGGLYEPPISGTGFMNEFAVGNPAPGAEFSQTVPTNAHWRLLGIRATLATSVTVATRGPLIVVDNGATTVHVITPSATQAASLTNNYTGGIFGHNATVLANEAVWAFPSGLIMKPGWRVRSSTQNIQGGDQWSSIEMVMEEYLTQ